ncbi:protein unc-79 homolog isoform X1 [Dermacentor albipictus]|uniref:protein unc-79 homolog isoform X1 n=1 Tax=Dermacentor albipictus TaxID=60249 RepID=UPI0038FCDA80
MGTRAAAFTAKIRNLHDYHTRILHGLPPLPSGVDVANTLKYFSQTLLSVLKDVPSIPLDMIRCHEKDHARTTLFPSLDYKALYHAIVQLVDAVPVIQSGAHALGYTILNTLACLVPFLEHEYMDTLPYIVASSMALFPASLHKDIVDMLCNHLLPYTITNPVDADALNYANMSTSAVIMMVFQYTENVAYQTQLLECLMSLKRDIVKDLLCVIAHGTAKARHPAVEMLFHYWPTLNPMLRDKKGFSIRHSGSCPIGWKPLMCQRESCVSIENKEAYKMCLDHSIAIASGERPPPLFVCQGCADQIRREHGPNHLMDVLLPMQEISLHCENKNCSGREKSASVTCFSMECASFNGNRPIRYCGQCFQGKHAGNNERASQHVALRPIPSPWSMDRETQLYFVEAIVSLLKEAQPSSDKGGIPSKESTTDRHSRLGGLLSEGPEESLECMAQEERQLLSRYGVWLLVGLCTPEDNTLPETLGRLLGMLFQWFHYTACLPDDQTGNSLERLKTEYIHGWLMDIARTHFDVFVSCLLPHPAEYAQVGGHWDNWPCQTDQIKEGFKTLLCLVPYDIINRDVWEYIMPHWMEAFRFEIPEEELSELKILLSKILDPDLSPLGFNIMQMYGFLTARFENTTVQVQEQALYWLQILTMLEVPVPLNLLFSMFSSGVQVGAPPTASDATAKEGPAQVTGLTPRFHPLRQDTTGTMLGSLGLDCDQLPSFLPEDAPPREEKSDAEVTLSCHILMVDILIKQLELQEITAHRGLATNEAREILTLLHAMLRFPREQHQCCQAGCAGGAAGAVPVACLSCEMTAIWYQLVLALVEFFCPVMEVAMADIPTDPSNMANSHPPISPKPLLKDDPQRSSSATPPHRTQPSLAPLKEPAIPTVPESQESPESLVDTESVSQPVEVQTLMTATLEECTGHLDTVAIMPTEQVVTAFARAVTLTEDDVPEAKCTVASATLVDENDHAVLAPEPAEDSSFWHTSQGKFRFTIDELPPQLRLTFALLKEMAVHEDADVLYHLLTCLKLLSLHTEVLNRAAHDHRGFLIWCQENLLVANLWKLLQAEFSQIARLCVPLLLHCVTLPSGMDMFWKAVEADFHSDNWRDRFAAVEKVTMIAHFVESNTVKNSPLLQSSLANAFSYLVHCLDDIQASVAERALLSLDSIKTSSLKLLVWCLEAQFDTVILDRPMILQTVFQLYSHLSERRFLTWDFFLNRFDALFMEAQISLERSGEISYTRDLKNSNKNSEVFQRKLNRAHEALSLTRTGRTLTASLGTKWPYKRAMSAPGGMISRQDKMVVDKEKIYGRQSSAPVLKRKSSRMSAAGTFSGYPSMQHFPNSFFPDGNLKDMMQEEGHFLHVVHRVMDMEDHDKDTLHLLIFLLMEFLSRPDHSHPTEEKAMARNQLIVLRHLNILLGYSQAEKGFLVTPNKLRASPVFNAFLASMPKVLDYNFKIGNILLSTCMPVLIYCPSPQRYSHEHASPRYTLWLLDPPARHSWLRAVLVVLYKFDYGVPPLSRQVQMLVRILLNTLDAQNHQCKNIPEPFLSPVPSRSRDLSTASVDLENIQEHDGSTPLDLGLAGDEIRFAFGPGTTAEAKASYHKPLVRDIHDTGKETADRAQWKALKLADFSCSGDEDEAEPELEAIPESPKSESSDMAEFGGELEALAPSVPMAELAEQARVRVVKDILPGQESIKVVDTSWQLAEEPVLVGSTPVDSQPVSLVPLGTDGQDSSQVHIEKSLAEPMEKPTPRSPQAIAPEKAEADAETKAVDDRCREASQSPSQWQNSSSVPPDQKTATTVAVAGKCGSPQPRPEIRLPDVHPSDIKGKVAAVKKVFEARATSDAAAAFASSRKNVVSLDTKLMTTPKERALLTSKSTTDIDDGEQTGSAPLSPSKSPKPRIHRMGAVDLGSLRVKAGSPKPSPPKDATSADDALTAAVKSPKKVPKDSTADATTSMVSQDSRSHQMVMSPKKTFSEPTTQPKSPGVYVKEPATAQRSLDMLTAKLRSAVPRETVHRTRSESSQVTVPRPLPPACNVPRQHGPIVLEPLMVRPTPERLLPIGPQPKSTKPFMPKQLSMGSLGPGADFRFRHEPRQADVFLLEASRGGGMQTRPGVGAHFGGALLGPQPLGPMEIPSLERLLPVGPMPTRQPLDTRSSPGSPARRLKARSQSTDTNLVTKHSDPDLLARVKLASTEHIFTFPDIQAVEPQTTRKDSPVVEKAHPSANSPQRQPPAQMAGASAAPSEEGSKGSKGGTEAAADAASKERVRPQEHSISGGLIDMLVKDVILDKVLSAAGRVETAFLTHGSNSLEVKDDEEAAPHPEKGASDEARTRLHYRPRKQRKSGLSTVEIQRTLEARGGAARRARKSEPSSGGPTPSKRRPGSSGGGGGGRAAVEEAVPERCPECALALEHYTDEELGLCIVLLATFVHRQPALAAPLLPEILRLVAKVASQVYYPWQHESNVHLPGGCKSIARQFIRCTLHQLSTNGIFQQIFTGSFDADFFKVMAAALADFNELNQMQPLMILFEELTERKHVAGEQLLQVLGNVATYLECLAPEGNALLWTAFLPQLDALLRKLLLSLPPAAPPSSSGGSGGGSAPSGAAPLGTPLEPLLRLLLCVMRVPTVNTCKSILDPFSKILSYAIQHSLIQYQQLLELCHLCNRNMSRERDKLVFTRTVVFELVQALKFKSAIPDENLLVLVQFVLQDTGGVLSPNVIVEDLLLPQDLQNTYNTGASECMRQNLNEVLEFVADVHALIRIKSNFHGTASRLNEETLGGQVKAGMAQYLALEITRGNGRDNRAIGKYLPWLYHPPSSLQQGPKEFIDCVAHIRLLSWLLVGALMHSALLGSTTNFVCQPIPLEANGHIADHIQVILAGFAEQSKASVLHMSSLFHAFILCQLWTMYCEHMVSLNPPGSEQSQLYTLTLTDFWIKITPGILQLVCHSKVASHSQLAEMVSLHFLSLMEALLECNSTVLARLLPMWTPVLYSYQGQLPSQLKVRLQACLDWLPPIQTREEATFVSSNFLKWLQRIQFKMGQIELQSSAATQFYSV